MKFIFLFVALILPPGAHADQNPLICGIRQCQVAVEALQSYYLREVREHSRDHTAEWAKFDNLRAALPSVEGFTKTTAPRIFFSVPQTVEPTALYEIGFSVEVQHLNTDPNKIAAIRFCKPRGEQNCAGTIEELQIRGRVFTRRCDPSKDSKCLILNAIVDDVSQKSLYWENFGFSSDAGGH